MSVSAENHYSLYCQLTLSKCLLDELIVFSELIVFDELIAQNARFSAGVSDSSIEVVQ
ncbi:MAG: hypothetical protein KUG82_07925 [Pseudomonadales bacterium]|nr:hypothetical protein [Pseudomonadales bacterium]